MMIAQSAFGQSGTSSTNYLLITLIILGAVILVFAILSLADNLIQIEAQKSGVDTKRNNLGIFPSFSGLFAKKAPLYAKDDNYVNLTKGYDLKLAGSPQSSEIVEVKGSRYAIKPTDFRGISPIPKVVVAVGDEVKAGDTIFFDKKRPSIMYASPVSGEVVEIKRGAKRAITEVIILADKEVNYKNFTVASLDAP